MPELSSNPSAAERVWHKDRLGHVYVSTAQGGTDSFFLRSLDDPALRDLPRLASQSSEPRHPALPRSAGWTTTSTGPAATYPFLIGWHQEHIIQRLRRSGSPTTEYAVFVVDQVSSALTAQWRTHQQAHGWLLPELVFASHDAGITVQGFGLGELIRRLAAESSGTLREALNEALPEDWNQRAPSANDDCVAASKLFGRLLSGASTGTHDLGAIAVAGTFSEILSWTGDQGGWNEWRDAWDRCLAQQGERPSAFTIAFFLGSELAGDIEAAQDLGKDSDRSSDALPPTTSEDSAMAEQSISSPLGQPSTPRAAGSAAPDPHGASPALHPGPGSTAAHASATSGEHALENPVVPIQAQPGVASSAVDDGLSAEIDLAFAAAQDGAEPRPWTEEAADVAAAAAPSGTPLSETTPPTAQAAAAASKPRPWAPLAAAGVLIVAALAAWYFRGALLPAAAPSEPQSSAQPQPGTDPLDVAEADQSTEPDQLGTTGDLVVDPASEDSVSSDDLLADDELQAELDERVSDATGELRDEYQRQISELQARIDIAAREPAAPASPNRSSAPDRQRNQPEQNTRPAAANPPGAAGAAPTQSGAQAPPTSTSTQPRSAVGSQPSNSTPDQASARRSPQRTEEESRDANTGASREQPVAATATPPPAQTPPAGGGSRPATRPSVSDQSQQDQPGSSASDRGPRTRDGYDNVVLPGPGVTLPVATRTQQPEYPRAGRRLGEEATVRLRVLVDERGRVLEVRIASDPGHGFGEAAQKAARRFRFQPASYQGNRVKIWLDVDIDFRLEDADLRGV